MIHYLQIFVEGRELKHKTACGVVPLAAAIYVSLEGHLFSRDPSVRSQLPTCPKCCVAWDQDLEAGKRGV